MNKKYGYFKGTKIEYHNMEILEVIKNKTRFICDCPKCSGEKKLKEYAHVEEGRCFKCGGTGRLELTKVLYTEKEVNNKIEKYKNKQSNEFEQKILKANEQDKIDAGFKKGFVYAVCGNTYNIKDELKAAGARWNKELKTWTFENEVANYKVKKINYEDITETSKVYNDSDVLRTMIDVVKLVKTRESIRNN